MGKRNKNDTKKYIDTISEQTKKSKQLLVHQAKKGNNGVIKI